MLFNSFPFLIFAPLFFLAYFWTRGQLRLVVCLAASYFFYSWWDWRFLSLIIGCTLANFYGGLWISILKDQRWRKAILVANIVLSLAMLGVFKYLNFFMDSCAVLLKSAGLGVEFKHLNIILPVGISFFTFMTLNYTIDLYYRKIAPERSLLRFGAFVAIFPHLLAGPILRANHVLPQFQTDHSFDWGRFLSGMNLILMGYFKKVVVADSLSKFVDNAFDAPGTYNSLSMILAVVFYAFQIYCDFSGYSDVAIGLGRIMGLDFGANFRSPYFSSSFSEFWTRWHISLSSWLRDYLYIPLGGNRNGTFKTQRNLMLTMLLGGLWHGANWTFVIWGGLHGAYLILQRAVSGFFQTYVKWNPVPPIVMRALMTATVFTLVCVAWVFFRAQTLGTAWMVFKQIATFNDLNPFHVVTLFSAIKGVLVIALLLAIELFHSRVSIPRLLDRFPVLRVTAYATAVWLIVLLGTFDGSAFIYFQF